MKHLSLWLVFIMNFIFVGAQQGLYFKHFTREEGLPSSYVESIIQDHDGFLWFGTAEGLCRYDGYSFLNLVNSPSDSTSLTDNGVTCLMEDKLHNLWVGTRVGLTYLDLNTYKFKRYSEKNDVGSSYITSMCFIDDKTLCIGTMSNGVYLFSPGKENFLKVNSLINNRVNSVVLDRAKNIWIATEGGLDKLLRGSNNVSHIVKGVRFQSVSLDNEGKIIAVSDNALYTVDPVLNRVVNQEVIFRDTKNRLRQALFTRNGDRWLAVTNQGVIVTRKKDKTSIQVSYENYKLNGINSKAPLVIYEDHIGNVWVGTFDGGVNMWDRYRKPFVGISRNSLNSGLQSNHIRSIFQDRDGEIWIGTKTDGMLSKFDPKTETFVHYKYNPSDPYSLNDDAVSCIADAKPGCLWVGTLTGGLNLFEKRTGRFVAVKQNNNNPQGLHSNVIMAMLNDDVGNLWIGHNNNGIDVYNVSKKEFTHFVSSSASGSLTDNRVRVIYKDRAGDIWIGTMAGFNRYDRRTHSFIRYQHNVNDKNSISDNYIQSIYEDKNRNLWIGTPNGINLMDRRKGTFVRFNRENGFPANSARGILDDSHGILWISTDNGIVRFDPVRKDFKMYTKEDGLQSNELALYAQVKTSNGEMYFGSEQGVNIFTPEKITDNKLAPNVVLVNFLLFNRQVSPGAKDSPLQSNISRTKELTLTYKQSVFTLEFSALNFSSPEKNQYAYKMEGFDKNWNYIGNKRSATYTNLPAGKYIFRVKASNNDGVWNEQGTSLKITILPPPWKTWWAYCIYLGILTIGLMKYRSFTIKRIHQEKERELDQMKLNLFVNVSHEFRTPLTLMLNPLEKIQHSEDINEMRMSAQTAMGSARRLLSLVNQLLDFRKIDLGKTELRVCDTDVVKFTRQNCSMFEDLAKAKGLDIIIESTLANLNVWIDPDKFEKILANLLSNAIKFTDPGGVITVSINKIEKNVKKTFLMIAKSSLINAYAEITVTDTGVGIKEEDLKNIFGRFFQVDSNRVGTGIGLNYTKSLVELHGGEILIESQYGQGTTFVVRIPLGDKHLKSGNVTFISYPKEEHLFDTSIKESLQYDIENNDNYPIEENDAQVKERLSNQMILIVEDNKTLRRQIREVLESKYIVKEAANGLEGLEKIQKYLPDLIISDIMMPKMDGIELCKRVKSDINTSHIPIILLTAKGSTEDKIEGLSTGADDYFPKPFNIQLLEIRIENLIKSRIALREKYSSSKTLISSKECATNNLDEAFLQKATKIVIDDIDNPDFSLAKFYEKLGMSRTVFFFKINSLTGQNPTNFIRTIRLKYAAQMLLSEKTSVKDIGYKCGFNSSAYFVKAFRDFYGQTPKEYVESHFKKGDEESETSI